MRAGWIAAAVWILSLTVVDAALGAEVFAGAIGDDAVVVVLRPALKTEPGGSSGAYFIRRDGNDIALYGDASAASFTLTERAAAPGGGQTAQPQVTAIWAVTRTGNRLDGRWIRPDGSAARSVRLERIAVTRPYQAPAQGPDRSAPLGWLGAPSPGAAERLPYLMERARLPATTGPEVTVGVGAYRLITDQRTGVSWPRLTRFPDAAAMARLNAAFERNRAVAIADAEDCLATTQLRRSRDRTSPPQAPRIVLLRVSGRMISGNVGGSLDCGGAHPINFTNDFTYDVATGRLVMAADVLRLDTPVQRAEFLGFWRSRMRDRATRLHNRDQSECADIYSTLTEGELTARMQVRYRLTDAGLEIWGADQSGPYAQCNVLLAELSRQDLAPFLVRGADVYWR